MLRNTWTYGSSLHANVKAKLLVAVCLFVILNVVVGTIGWRGFSNTQQANLAVRFRNWRKQAHVSSLRIEDDICVHAFDLRIFRHDIRGDRVIVADM